MDHTDYLESLEIEAIEAEEKSEVASHRGNREEALLYHGIALGLERALILAAFLGDGDGRG